jgi:uncharacterized phage protein gp47/JayE
MAGLTPQGFVIKPFDEIQSEKEQELSDAFSLLGQELDLRPESVVGQLIGIGTETDADFWALLQFIYFSQYPEFASGMALDLACSLTRTTRIKATPTQVEAIVYGLDTTVIPALSQAADAETGKLYNTLSDVTITKALAVSATLSINTVGTGAYTVTVNSVPYTHTATGTPTVASILTGLQTALSGAPLVAVNAESLLTLTSGTAFAFTTSSNITINQVGSVATFFGVDAGADPLPASALADIATPIAGWVSINNLVDGVTGLARESDEALRLRRARARDNSALGAIENLVGVTDAKIKENNTDSTDSDSVPRQHIWAIVEGGDNSQIASAIVLNKAAGIGTYGTGGAVTVNLVSPNTGDTFPIKFDRPNYLEPLIEVEYTITGAFPPDGVQQIKDALVAFGDSLKISESMNYSRLYTPVNTIPGMKVDILVKEDVGDTAERQDIVAATNEKVRILEANITVSEAS